MIMVRNFVGWLAELSLLLSADQEIIELPCAVQSKEPISEYLLIS